MSRHVSVIASLAYNYLATASLIVCSLAIVPIAIRYLGDVGYGTWLGLTALAAVGSMADMGVSGVLVVRLSQALEQARDGEARAELFNGLAVSALSSIVGGLIVLGSILAAEKLSPGSFATSGHNLFIAVAVAITAAMSQFSVSLTALPTSQLRPIVTGAIGIAAPIAWLLASWLLLPRFGVMGLAIGLLVRSGVTLIPLAIYNAFYLSGHGASGGVSLDLGRCRSFAMLGTLGLAVRWIQSIQATFDVVCVSTIQGPGAAALYANTARPTGMATGLANAFGGALLPAFTRFLAREQGPPAFRLFLNSLRLTVIMAGALAISFEALAARAASRSRKPPQDAGLGARIAYAAGKVVTIRQVDDVEGDSPDALVARADLALKEGEVVAALALLDRLPPKGRAALASWREGAERRAVIDRVVAALRLRAVRDLSPASGAMTEVAP